MYKKTIEGLVKVDVIYRRIDDDYLDPDQGNPKSAIGVKGLIKAWQQKKVAIVNSPGCGIADDKAVYAFVPKMIKYFFIILTISIGSLEEGQLLVEWRLS